MQTRRPRKERRRRAREPTGQGRDHLLDDAATTTMASLRTVAATAGAVAAFLLLGPQFAAFVVASVPCVYAALAAWLAPPYLYLLINAIIISIAASSRFHKLPRSTGVSSVLHQLLELQPAADVMVVPPPEYVPPTEFEVKVALDVETTELQYEEKYEPDLPSGRADYRETREKLEPKNEEEVEKRIISTSESWSLTRSDSVEIRPENSPATAEKPLVSVRFGGQRRSRKASLDGKEALRRVAHSRRNETLESTWRAITEGRAVPLARHLKKSDTMWDVDSRNDVDSSDVIVSADAAPLGPRKFDTFNDRWTSTAGRPHRGAQSGSKINCIRREPSPGLDELNRRVEAFIRKFNEEMRLQRQESLRQYMDMINRST